VTQGVKRSQRTSLPLTLFIECGKVSFFRNNRKDLSFYRERLSDNFATEGKEKVLYEQEGGLRDQKRNYSLDSNTLPREKKERW